MHGTKSPKRFTSVGEFFAVTGVKKNFAAMQWGISPFQVSALVHEGRYPVSLTDEQMAAVAESLGQTVDYVREILERIRSKRAA